MTNENFETMLNDTFDKSKSVLLAKAGEYAADGDRLHNFKRAAHLQGITPVRAALYEDYTIHGLRWLE